MSLMDNAYWRSMVEGVAEIPLVPQGNIIADGSTLSIQGDNQVANTMRIADYHNPNNRNETKFRPNDKVKVIRDIKLETADKDTVSEGVGIGKCWECNCSWNSRMNKFANKTFVICKMLRNDEVETYLLQDEKGILVSEGCNFSDGWHFCRHWLLAVDNDIKQTHTVKGDRVESMIRQEEGNEQV